MRQLLRLAHQHLAGALRHFGTHAGGTVDDDGHSILVACPAPYSGPLFNAAIRTDGQAEAGRVVARTQRFFAARPRRYALWIPDDVDVSLERAAQTALLSRDPMADAPVMALLEPIDPPTLPHRVVVTQVCSAKTGSQFGLVAAQAFTSFGSPAEATRELSRRVQLLAAHNVAAFVGYLDGAPTSCGLVLVTGEVAGVYFIGTISEARGRGLGEMMTRVAAHAGFRLGARAIVLQSTTLAVPLYRRIGFEEFSRYRLYTGDSLSGEAFPVAARDRIRRS
jgi:ribosomal protein S18 acetylase RimI-like enzyme